MHAETGGLVQVVDLARLEIWNGDHHLPLREPEAIIQRIEAVLTDEPINGSTAG